MLYEMQEAGTFYFDHRGDIDRQTLLKNPDEANKRLQINFTDIVYFLQENLN